MDIPAKIEIESGQITVSADGRFQNFDSQHRPLNREYSEEERVEVEELKQQQHYDDNEMLFE